MAKIRVKVFKHKSRSSHSTTVQYFCKAKLIGKRIKVDHTNLTDTQKSYYEKPIAFNYRFIDQGLEVFNEKINTELNGAGIHFYCKLNLFQRFKLKKEFKRLWIQQPENFKWIIMAIMTGIGVFLAFLNFVFNCK